MAAGILPAPGTDNGPCVTPCMHTGCATTITMAEVMCPYCSEPIGYGRRFYCEGDDKVMDLAHASCLEDDCERVRREQADARDRRGSNGA